MSRRVLYVAAALLLSTSTAPAEPGSGAAGAEDTPGWRGVLSIRGERTVASENADRLFVPASVQKLVVAAAALHHLGPEHRIMTELHAGGVVDGGMLQGDLILRAAADPTWSRRFFETDPAAPLAALARQLAESGVHRVEGDLVVDLGRFPGRPFPPSRPASEYAYGYAAPASPLAYEENRVRVEIAAGPRVGAAGKVRLLSETAGALALVNRIRTVSRERHGVGTVDFLPVWEDDTIVVRGEYPISEPAYVIEIAVPSPALHAARAVAGVLRRGGVEIAGEARLEHRPVATMGPVLARLASPTLASRLEPILTDSHNWHAEMLLRALAEKIAGEGRPDEGLEIVRRFLTEVVGVAEGSFHLDDASGLSPYNLITPRAVVELLRWIRRQPWRASFLDALPRNGEGTLEAWRGLPPVAAKTGTIRHSLALAGYLDPEGAEPTVFACFLNHRPGERPTLRAEIAGLVRDWR